jgi:hypothetical protein
VIVNFLYSNPTWVVGLVVVGIWTGLSLLGLWIFSRFSNAQDREKDTETVGLTYAIVAVVYAVLIAFIVVDVYETFSRADEVATAEANQISNVMFATAGLPSQVGKAVRGDLNQYLDIVIKTEWPSQQAGNLEEAVFDKGWDSLAHLSTSVAVFEPATLGQNANKAAMLHSINELIKARRTRILAAGEHLPDIVWQILLIAGAVAVVYTYLFGAHNFRIHLTITGLVATTIALAFVLIIALDYPFRGDVSVSDDAFSSVQAASAGAFATEAK